MSELVGVIDSFNALRPSFLKRTALLFDKMALPPLSEDTIEQWLQTQPYESQELLWLMEKGIVFQAKNPTTATSFDEDTASQVKQIARSLENSLRAVLGQNLNLDLSTDELKKLVQQELNKPDLDHETKLRVIGHYIHAGEHISRLFGCFLRNDGINAYPVLPFSLGKGNSSSTSDVIEIVFNNFPTPSEQTPWEQILEYRADPESKAKFLELRNWINEVVREKLSRRETEEKLEYLLSQYERHLNLHKMKANSGIIETVVVSTAEMAENLIKLKFSDLAKMAFSAKQRTIALLEGELTSPGSEVAYIVKTKETFV